MLVQMLREIRVGIPVVVLMLTACFAGPPDGIECSDYDDIRCPPGKLCIDFTCHAVCSDAATCGPLEACVSGACQVYVSTCSFDDPCVEGWFCDDGDVCRKILEKGQVCQDSTQCRTGFCVDGRCCESACDGLCLACESSLTLYPSGTCTGAVAGIDPHDQCAGDLACNGAGACYDTPIGASCDGRETCPSGYCVDGVCCERACDGTCEACSSSLTGAVDGVCAALADGSDPQDECEGELTCSGFRACHASYGEACALDGECEGSACLDALCGLAAPRLLAPPNGETTGTVHVAAALTPRLRWREAAGWYAALSYELQVDDSCDPTAFQSCTFPSPELETVVLTTEHTPAAPLPVSHVQPVGRRYYWRVRTCASASECSTWSEVRYLDVGRQKKDFNGDGYADMVVGQPAYDPGAAANSGAACIYFGAARVTLLAKTVPDQTLVNPDAEPGARFGEAVRAVGDLDGDGYADLAVGAPYADADHDNVNESTDEGAVFVYYGSAAGLVAPPAVVLSGPVGQARPAFGYTLAGGGDVDGDGHGDLAVGAPGFDEPVQDAGAVYIFAWQGRDASPAEPLVLQAATHGDRDLFGMGLSMGGDVDGDGRADVVVGASGATATSEEQVCAFRVIGSETLLRACIPSPTVLASAFGWRVVSDVDLDGDGRADVLVSDPLVDTLYTFLGSDAALLVPPTSSVVRAQDKVSLGASVVSIRSVDGVARVAVGASTIVSDPLDENTGGGTSNPPPGTDLRSLEVAWLFSAESPGNLDQTQVWGPAIAASVASPGDMDGDGYGDLWMSAAQVSVYTNAVLFGTPDGFPDTPAWSPSIVSSYID